MGRATPFDAQRCSIATTSSKRTAPRWSSTGPWSTSTTSSTSRLPSGCSDARPTVAERTIAIGGRRVGPGEPPLVIAEIGQNHDGSLGLAHAHIDAAADAGADAVKLQTHIAAAESTFDEPF